MGLLTKKKKTPALSPETQRDVDLLASLRKAKIEREAEREAAYAARGLSVAAGIPDDQAAADYDAACRRINDLTAAIAAVERRMGDALERLKQEERQAQLKELAAALAVQKADARKVEAAFETLRETTKALAASYNTAMASAKALDDAEIVGVVHDALLKFKFYLLHAVQHMPACATPHVEHLKPYADNFPDRPTPARVAKP